MYVCMYVYNRERDLCSFRRIRARILPLKYQHPTFKYNIHSVEVDLYYFKRFKLYIVRSKNCTKKQYHIINTIPTSCPSYEKFVHS